MKRKAIVLLSSVLASALLVGGSFAAFAVTDNADPFGINVTPGDLDVDDTTYVTLKWGDTTGLTGIGNIKVGENRKAGIVSLKATPAYTGVFSLEISDVTTAEKETTDAKLLDYLNVYVYDGALDLVGEEKALPSGEEVVKKGEILKTTAKVDGKKKISLNLEGTPAGRELTVFVNLDSSASPVFSQMSEDKVYLEVDWSPKAGEEATDRVVYFSKPSAWTDLYAFAWTDEKVNKAWPGVQMVHAYDDVYSIAIPTGLENIIFNKGESGEGNQTGDISLATYDQETKPYWNGTAWAAKPAAEVGLVMSATVDDEEIALLNVKDPSSTDRAVYKVNLEVGQVIKFKDGNTDVKFYHWVPEPTQEDPNAGHDELDGTSYTATVAGLHTFYYNKDSKMYAEQPAPVVVYYLVGKINGIDAWDSTDHAFIANPGNEGEYMLPEAIALKADDGLKVMNGTSYYPDGSGNEWKITEDGNYQVYFRPAGNSEWANGYFFVAKITA